MDYNPGVAYPNKESSKNIPKSKTPYLILCISQLFSETKVVKNQVVKKEKNTA